LAEYKASTTELQNNHVIQCCPMIAINQPPLPTKPKEQVKEQVTDMPSKVFDSSVAKRGVGCPQKDTTTDIGQKGDVEQSYIKLDLSV
jgi:hypothetical protein